MTASPSRRAPARGLCLALALGLLLPACARRAFVPTDGLLDAEPGQRALAPSDSDLAAARLAEAALATGGRPDGYEDAFGPDPASVRMLDAFDELVSAEAEDESLRRNPLVRALDLRRSFDEPDERFAASEELDSRIIPLGIDVMNSTLDDPRAYRSAARDLRSHPGVDAALDERLKRAIADDPLKLARDRTWDDFERKFAYHFNAVSAPLGKSLMTGFVMAPYQIAMSGISYVAGMFKGESFSTQERQAHSHRLRFLRRNPEASEAEKVRRQVARGESQLASLFRDRNHDSAKTALDSGQPRLAIAMAKRALTHVPEDPKSIRLLSLAHDRVDRQRLVYAETMRTRTELPDDVEHDSERARRLAEALWLGSDRAAELARELAEADETGELDDEVEYVLATLQLEAGYEDASWRRMERLADEEHDESNMARHAAALVRDPWQNPYRSFLEEQSEATEKAFKHELMGSFAKGPRIDWLPRPIAWLFDLPNLAKTVATTPLRLIMSLGRPRPDFQQDASRVAYRYLDKNPDGEHREEILRWLYDYEKGRGNWDAALRLADFIPDTDPEERRRLSEYAAERRIQVADRIKRRDQRGSVLRDVVRTYPDTVAGHHAGIQVRQEVEHASAQRIRMTRSFLVENPGVAGPRGLGIRHALLDGRVHNGEIHPRGVTFLGGQAMEFSLLAEDGDEDAEPVRVRKLVSGERLSRTIALLEEAQQRNSQLDPDDDFHADARRDLFFERARLGLTERPDVRPTAESTYVFQSMRERYGMVRGRDSILPFDLVFQGSLQDLTLGAFPRWRAPKETPDAFLYR